MIVLILGLVLFLGVHSVQIAAPGWRSAMVERLGENAWKGIYSLVSLAGFVLIVWGYGLARVDPVPLWDPPLWLKHVALLLNLIAFILFAAYLVPAGRMKARLGHPMLLAVKTWAIAHLLANGTLADVILFGTFLVWAVLDFRSSRQRERAAGTVRVAGPVINDVIVLVVGVAIWAAFAFYLHQWLIAVDPLA